MVAHKVFGRSTGRILSIGEPMLELSEASDGLWKMGVAGDSLNTAWYLRALLPAGWAVEYLTRLGLDHASEKIIAFLAERRIKANLISRDPVLSAGLYMIELTNGERSFSYWRGQSAARHLADDAAYLGAAMLASEVVFFTGITLAILPSDRRETFLAAVSAARAAGCWVVFDTNLRPKLWESVDAMRHWLTQAAQHVDLILPSFDEEQSAFGDADIAACANRYAGLGAHEIVIKNGNAPLFIWQNGAAIEVGGFEVLAPIDTTGAGDSFNGGYIAARILGADCRAAAALAQKLASKVLMAKGAMIDVQVADLLRLLNGLRQNLL